MKPSPRTPVARFGIYEVSFDSGEVRRAGLKIRMQQQPLKLLQVLLERPGEVVSREELRNRLWASESFVGSSRVDLQACKLEYSIVSPK